MAVISRMNSSEGGKNLLQNCLNEEYLQAVRPSAKQGVSVIRPVPEVSPDGTIRPMIKGQTPDGPDFHNFYVAPVTVYSGRDAKFTGLAYSSDVPDEGRLDMVFPGLFIKLRGRQKKKEIPSHLKEKVDALLEGELKAHLKPTQDMALVQCVVAKLNGDTLEKRKARQVAFLTTTAAAAVAEVLAEADKRGIDVFSPKDGREIILTPHKERSGITVFEAELGDKMPISEDKCRKLWVPWEKALKTYTREQHLKKAVACFGRDIVSFAFPEQYEELYGAGSSSSSKPGGYEPPEGDDLPGQSTTTEAPSSSSEEGVIDDDLDMDLSTSIDDGSSSEELKSRVGGELDVPSDAGETGDLGDEIDPKEAAARYEELIDDSDL